MSTRQMRDEALKDLYARDSKGNFGAKVLLAGTGNIQATVGGTKYWRDDELN